MESLKLVARIAGQRIALAADAIESVVEVESVTPVPLASSHIAGLSALRSRVLTIIDSYAALGLGQAPRRDMLQAIVVTVDNHLYGLLVDEVEDVVELSAEPKPLHAGLARGWGNVALGLVEHEGAALLLLDAVRIVSGPPATAIAA
jgi:purine-binding chemotaxis protein CheW